ncbi:MAG TPA: tetratricopeptide repeat protein [Actinophytocola sp.]|nr:tetratricopeptide repeat protein [Actinophytocola sp.]
MNDAAISALHRALDAVPDDTALRLHLAQTLLAAGRCDEAVGECATRCSGIRETPPPAS